MYDKERKKESAYQFFQSFEDLRRLRKEDFQDGNYILDKPYSSVEEEEENKRNVKDAIFEAENIMEMEFRDSTFLLLYLLNQDRLNWTSMPTYDLVSLI